MKHYWPLQKRKRSTRNIELISHTKNRKLIKKIKKKKLIRRSHVIRTIKKSRTLPTGYKCGQVGHYKCQCKMKQKLQE